MKLIILSDVHLDVDPAHRERMTRFTAFLRALDPSRTTRMIILGDLFDFWFEYRHVVFSGYFQVMRALADLRDQGMAFDLVCGNHDFWGGRFLEEQLGFTLHRAPITLDIGPHRVLFAHGDGLNHRDIGYRAYKRVARARPVIRLFRLLHPDWAMALAHAVSRGSRRLTQEADVAKGSEARALEAFAQGVLARGEADVVMCGHAHYPVRREYPTPNGKGLYINTGDWLLHRTLVAWDGAEFALLQAVGDSEIIPYRDTRGAEEQAG